MEGVQRIVRFSSVVSQERAKSNGHIKRQETAFNHKKQIYFTMRMIKHCNKFCKEVVESLSMQIFDAALNNLR